MKVRVLLAAAAALGLLMLAAAGLGSWTSNAPGAVGGEPPPIGVLVRLSVNGNIVSYFSEIELKSGFATPELELGPKGVLLPVKRQPPSVRLSHGLTTNLELAAWHEAALAGAENGRRDTEIAMLASDGTPIARWSLTSAWPSKYDIDGLTGDAAPRESVTLVGDRLLRIAP